jgi:tetratricopeptide (TPR) repeat protein
MKLIDRFFDKEFFALLGKRPLPKIRIGKDGWGRRLRGAPASKQAAELGFAVAPRLAKLLNFAGTYNANEVGELRMFPACDELPEGANALAFMLNHQYRIDSMMIHTLALGDNGSGDLWLVSMAPVGGRHDVFFFDHDEGGIEHVADSIEAFALALHLSDRLSAPVRSPTAAERRALVGHVANKGHLDLPWLPDELPVAASSPPVRLHGRTQDLRIILNGYVRRAPGPAVDLPARPLPGEALDAMLRAFLRVEDSTLRALFKRFARSASSLVRDAVSHLQRLLVRRQPATFERRIALLIAPRIRLGKAWNDRSIKRGLGTIDKAQAAARKAQESQAPKDHRAAIASLRRALKVVPRNDGFWNSLCYSLSCLGRWSDMLEAAKRATALAPKSSYAYQQLACAYAGLEDHAGAIHAGRRAIALDPDNAYATYNLAKALLMRKEAKGRDLLERARRLAPELRAQAESDPDIKSALAALDR